MAGTSSYILAKGDIELNAGRATAKVRVRNTGDRPIQVGSHYHFFEANRALQFERGRAFGMRLNIPSGTAVRFEPGDDKEVELVALGGLGVAYGFYGLVSGSARSERNRALALEKARLLGFKGVEGK